MKTTKYLVGFVLLLFVFHACNESDPISIKIDETEDADVAEINIDSLYSYSGKINVINDIHQLENFNDSLRSSYFFPPTNDEQSFIKTVEEYSSIDFSKNTLVIAHGRRPSGIHEVHHIFKQISENKYILEVRLSIIEITIVSFWNIVKVEPKMADNSVELDFEVTL